jgi:hypothetical protein
MRIVLGIVLAVALCCGAPSALADLVAAWPLEEDTGTTTVDTVTSTTSGAFGDGVSWSTDTPGPGSTASLSFTGATTARFGTNNNAADIGIDGTGAKTLVSWIKTAQAAYTFFWGWSPTNGTGAGQDIRFGLNSSGNLRFEVSSGFAEYTTEVLSDNEWHMVAAVIDAGDTTSTMQLYLDGALVSPNSSNGRAINTAGTGTPNQFFFASSGNTTDKNWNGLVDDFQIYNTALSEGELDAIYDAMAVPEPGVGSLVIAVAGLAVAANLRRRRTAG